MTATTNVGEVHITLDGSLATLRCTLRAAKEVNAVFGNYVDALRKLEIFDFFAYCAIVAAGLGKSSKEVEAAVYTVGMKALNAPLSQFVLLLSNGGRPAEDSDGAPKNPGEA